MEIVAVLLMVLGILITKIVLFATLLIWGTLNKKIWLQQTGIWGLLFTSILFCILFLISIPSYLVTSYFF